jgi:hypothetical protein
MYLKVVSPSANTNSHVLLFKERKYQYDLECSIAYGCCFSSRGVLYVIDSFMHAGMIVSRAQDQGLKCWDGFLHALLGSLHILELGGIATCGL